MAKQKKRSTGTTAAKPSPLFEAISERNEKAVRRILKSGDVDWSAEDANGRTPLQAARYYRSTEIEVMFLDAGAPLDMDDLNLYWAVGTKRADIDGLLSSLEENYIGWSAQMATRSRPV